MLNKITIKNIALIDCAVIDFSEGLNVLSGETGSGKSVIIDSLNFVLGAKADKSLIRSGESECSVIAEFSIENKAVFDVLDEFDFEKEDVLIISRKFSVDGKTSIKVNGNSVTVGMLKKITCLLVDVHGQSEHFSLLSQTNQLKLIDKFCGEELACVKDKARRLFEEYKGVCKQLDELGGDESSRLVRLDILEYQIREIEQAQISENEESELVELKKKLANQEKITVALSMLKQSVLDEGGVDDILGNVARNLYSIVNLSKEYEELYNRLEGALAEIDDVSSTAEDLLDNFDFGNVDADFIDKRLDLYKNLKKKYGNDYNEIIEFLDNCIKEKNKLENFTDLYNELNENKNKLTKELYELYLNIHGIRVKYSKIFAQNVSVELQSLAMSSATFSVNFEELLNFEQTNFNTFDSIDKIEFKFSANKGEPEKPLAFVISGGEMSRFMLAIKAQTAKFNDIGTFIFDEIDAGISGKTASIVAEKFGKISKDVQLIAITHLPQISAMADCNLLISKFEENDRTHTKVVKLDYDGKVNEITRLIGSNELSESAVSLVKNMILEAEKFKKQL